MGRYGKFGLAGGDAVLAQYRLLNLRARTPFACPCLRFTSIQIIAKSSKKRYECFSSHLYLILVTLPMHLALRRLCRQQLHIRNCMLVAGAGSNH